MNLMRGAWLIARKDIVVEVRSRELLYTTIFFAATCMLVFAFGFVQNGGESSEQATVERVAPGILWVTLAFSGTLALSRVFERERESDTLRALLLAPVGRPAVYIGKLTALVILMLGVDAVTIPLVSLWFGAPIGRSPLMFAALILTGTIGFGAVGTMFAAMLLRARSRDVLLPILLYPMVVPVMIAGVRGTAAIFAVEPDMVAARTWLVMLLSFDAVFVTLALWLFGPVMREE